MGLKAPLNSIVLNINRAYYDAVYGVSKAALSPVVDAINDVVREAVTEAIYQGVKDALSPKDKFAAFLFGRKN